MGLAYHKIGKQLRSWLEKLTSVPSFPCGFLLWMTGHIPRVMEQAMVMWHAYCYGQKHCYIEVKERVKFVRCYDKADYEAISRAINDINWEELLKNDDVNVMWEEYKKNIKRIEDTFIPQRKFRINIFRKGGVAIDDTTFQKIRRKNTLSRRCTSNKDPAVRREYNKIRNQVRRDMRRIKKNHERKLAKEAKENPKAVWRYINSKAKTKQGVGDLHIDPGDENSPTTDDDKEKAQILADFFQLSIHK